MILEDYIKKLQELEGRYGNMECILSGDPDETHYYWLTNDPTPVQMNTDTLDGGLKDKVYKANAILIN